MSVQKEYEKHSEIKPEEIQNLRFWLEEQPHLPCEHISGKHECIIRAISVRQYYGLDRQVVV